jgi:hypothetical protein
MQGTAADLIKMSMNAVQQALDATKPHIKMIMQVHDELVFEVPNEEIEATKARVTQWMNSAPTQETNGASSFTGHLGGRRICDACRDSFIRIFFKGCARGEWGSRGLG